MISANKIGFIFKPNENLGWWKSHAMAPAPILMKNNVIRIYIGGWSEKNISRIGYVDLNADNLNEVINVSKNPILDIGRDGCFDENGVFPAHVYDFKNGTVFLYYTGFQLGHKIRHYNFGGLAVSHDGGENFKRYSESPILDRSDEGLFVRAGQSIETDNNGSYHVLYSAGSSWYMCNGVSRPVYDIFYQKSADGIALQKNGTKIIQCNLEIEHGLGRPQIVRLGKFYYAFFTRRIIKDMKYFLGCARSINCTDWERMDSIFDGINFGLKNEFDNNMIYFPSILKQTENSALLFYSGNYFGEGGIGVIELKIYEHN